MQAQQPELTLTLTLRLKLHLVGDTTELLAGIDDGKCAAAVIYEDAWVTAQQYRRNCDKALVGTPLYGIGNGMPVREELLATFTWMITNALSSGTCRCLAVVKFWYRGCSRYLQPTNQSPCWLPPPCCSLLGVYTRAEASAKAVYLPASACTCYPCVINKPTHIPLWGCVGVRPYQPGRAAPTMMLHSSAHASSTSQ